jgi:hypothetical protein
VNVTSERANKSGLVPFYKIKITSWLISFFL